MDDIYYLEGKEVCNRGVTCSLLSWQATPSITKFLNHNFERNEDRATVFLKWTDFSIVTYTVCISTLATCTASQVWSLELIEDRGVARGGPEFGRSVNPFQTRGQIMPLTLLPASPTPGLKKLSTPLYSDGFFFLAGT